MAEKVVCNKNTYISVKPLFQRKDSMGVRKDKLTQGWTIVNPGDSVPIDSVTLFIFSFWLLIEGFL